jgi:hypothetical protein
MGLSLCAQLGHTDLHVLSNPKINGTVLVFLRVNLRDEEINNSYDAK